MGNWFNRLDKLTREAAPALTNFLLSIGDKGERMQIGDILRINPEIISWSIRLTSITDASYPVAGEMREVDNTVSASVATDFALANHHLYVYVDSITTGGDMVITGASVDENTGVVTDDDTETIAILTTPVDIYYQTTKKWLEVTNIDILAGTIDTIDFDYGAVGYLDLGNRNFSLTGMRVDFLASGATADIGIRIRKIQQGAAGQFTIVPVENIGIDATAGNGEIQDGIRTAGDDRSFTFGVTAMADGDHAGMKAGDYNTFFTNDENIIEGATKNEGFMIDFIGIPSGGILNIDHATVVLYIEFN